MSNLPSREGVQELRKMLDEYNQLVIRHDEIKKIMEELPAIKERISELHREIIKAMDNMDVKSDGNFGWERRIVWFLSELNDQSRRSND